MCFWLLHENPWMRKWIKELATHVGGNGRMEMRNWRIHGRLMEIGEEIGWIWWLVARVWWSWEVLGGILEVERSRMKKIWSPMHFQLKNSNLEKSRLSCASEALQTCSEADEHIKKPAKHMSRRLRGASEALQRRFSMPEACAWSMWCRKIPAKCKLFSSSFACFFSWFLHSNVPTKMSTNQTLSAIGHSPLNAMN